MAESRQERRRRERLEGGGEGKRPLMHSSGGGKKPIFIIIILAIVAIIAFAATNYLSAQQAGPYNPAANGPQIDVGEQSRGNINATVTITEYSDFECPFCAKFFSNAYRQLKSEYIDTGKVRLIYKQYPLVNTHKQSLGAAVAALCAADQGKFWEYHDLLFINQPRFSRVALESYAAQLGLGMQKFNQCLDDGATLGQVKREISEGNAAGVDGTPFFLVNGQKISGAQPIEAFRIVIEGELSKMQ